MEEIVEMRRDEDGGAVGREVRAAPNPRSTTFLLFQFNFFSALQAAVRPFQSEPVYRFLQLPYFHFVRIKMIFL